jgi:hypothetical protein
MQEDRLRPPYSQNGHNNCSIDRLPKKWYITHGLGNSLWCISQRRGLYVRWHLHTFRYYLAAAYCYQQPTDAFFPR